VFVRTTSDLDKLQSDRIDSLTKRWKREREIRPEDIFVSERVVASLSLDKALLPAFRTPYVLSLLPFVPNLYVLTCPRCVSHDSIGAFRQLTEAGLIVPILSAPYSKYPAAVIDAVSGLDHMSVYEFDFYRLIALSPDSRAPVCAHCVGESRSALIASAADVKDNGPRARKVREIFINLYPYSGTEEYVLDALEKVVSNDSGRQLNQLVTLSDAIRSTRTARALRAAQVIRDRDVDGIPLDWDLQVGDARTTALRMGSIVASGLKLRIPVDIPLSAYIELVRDYRPEIISLSKALVENATVDTEPSLSSLMTAITTINREIERIKNLRRYMVIEALAGFAQSNPAMTASLLIAGTLGVAGHLFGCAAVPAGALADIARRAGKLKGNDAAKRLTRKLHRDLQPYLDRLLARFVGTTPIAMQVMSIRQQMESEYRAPDSPTARLEHEAE
jgi:hypothetical protein